MHDISQLEAQWKRYKTKQRKPYYIASVGIVVLVAVLLGTSSSNWKMPKIDKYLPTFNTSSSNDSVTVTSRQNTHTVINSGLKHLEANTQNTIHEIKVEVEPEDTLVDIPILDLNGGEKPTVHHSRKGKVKLDIIETSSISAYRDVEERFKRSHDIDDAFFLAKSYFNKEDYEKSSYWALETNKLDAGHEESLLIFAKSKVKMGNRSEGISILQRYIRKTNSSAARNLLSTIESNRL